MGIVQKPNLPTNKATDIVISADAVKASEKLKLLGINTIKVPKNPNFDMPVNSHADMSFVHLGGETCVVQRECNIIVNNLTNLEFNVLFSQNEYKKEYPFDVGLNCVRINDILIGREDSLDKTVREFCENQNIEIINVNQGYSKCSICVVNENSIITEDDSIYNKLKSKLDVLKIHSGDVKLNGYNYGFFGGCTGLIDKNILAVNGEIKYHSSSKQIKSFLKERNVQILELKDGILEDIGSILTIREQG